MQRFNYTFFRLFFCCRRCECSHVCVLFPFVVVDGGRGIVVSLFFLSFLAFSEDVA